LTKHPRSSAFGGKRKEGKNPDANNPNHGGGEGGTRTMRRGAERGEARKGVAGVAWEIQTPYGERFGEIYWFKKIL